MKGVPPVAVVIGKTYAMAMAMVIAMVMMVIIPHKRMNNLLYLYL